MTARPILVVDLETTGLPGKLPRHLLMPIEFGACVVLPDGTVLRKRSILFRPPADVLDDPRIDGALQITGITRDELIRSGVPIDEAPGRLEAWAVAVAERDAPVFATSFNRAFDFDAFLRADPWFWREDLLPVGPCLMLAAQKRMGADGALHRWRNGEFKYPRVSEAASWLASCGVDLPHPARANRAGDDAWHEAMIAVGMLRQDGAAAWEDWTP